jgi:ArsR family transcriptional regulator, lead/cadmium/zinc/bismuth-responsive transcriptional repressor
LEGLTALDACGVRMSDPGKVAAARAALPPEEAVGGLADLFALLGEPGRLRLLAALAEAGELCVCDLAAACGLTESAASHALRLLRAHRVVSVSRRGRMAYYRLDDTHVRTLMETGLAHAGHGTASAAAAAAGT